MNYRTIVLVAIAGITASTAIAQNSSTRAQVDTVVRQQEQKLGFAADALRRGDERMALRDYEAAYTYYKAAVDNLPSGGSIAGETSANALASFSKAVVCFAKQRISEGRFEDAKKILAVLLDETTGYNKTCKSALDLANNLRDPDRYHQNAMSPQFIVKIEEVKQLLIEAQGFYDSGRYDLAFKRYEQVLNIDKYNIAARRGMEVVNKNRADYADTAYNETRSHMFNEVNRAWELPVRKFESKGSAIIEQPIMQMRGATGINRKLDEIIIPKVEFNQASLREAVAFLVQRAAAFDNTGDSNRGVNIIPKISDDSVEANTQIDLSLTDVPLRTVLDYVARAANMKIKVDPYAVVIVPESDPTDTLYTKEYKVSPSFIPSAPSSGGLGGPSLAGGASASAPGNMTALAERSGAKEYLQNNGVTFPLGATAIYLASSSKLIVKNTQSNLDVIDALVANEALNIPNQVEIETKFLEVTQNNVEELGFDWLMGNFNLPFGTGIRQGMGGSDPGLIGSGGSMPGGLPMGGFITDPSTGMISGNTSWPQLGGGMLPIGATGTNSGIVTSGNRSGTSAISVNAVDALLFATPLGPAPAVLSLAGVLSGAQFQVVLRALSQKKGVDLVSAPRVTTKSGQRATVEIVREFRYPADYDLPQVTSNVGSQYQPVVPSTPNSFDTRNVGITLEVEPTVASDNMSIDLVLAPRIVEFDGFINYGSPIYANVSGIVSVVANSVVMAPSQTIVATENIINRPVFSTREVTTEVTVYDGQTVMLGGLIREDVQKVQDKVPILGDIPILGRLFRSSAEQHTKRNLVMFVTANLVDYGGQPIVREEEIVPDVETVFDIPLPTK